MKQIALRRMTINNEPIFLEQQFTHSIETDKAGVTVYVE